MLLFSLPPHVIYSETKFELSNNQFDNFPFNLLGKGSDRQKSGVGDGVGGGLIEP